MKNWKNYAFVGILAIMVFASTFSCGGDTSIGGTWLVEGTENGIQFSGNNFTFITTPGRPRNFLGGYVGDDSQDGTGTYSISNAKQGGYREIALSFSDGTVRRFQFSREDKSTIKIHNHYLRKK